MDHVPAWRRLTTAGGYDDETEKELEKLFTVRKPKYDVSSGTTEMAFYNEIRRWHGKHEFKYCVDPEEVCARP